MGEEPDIPKRIRPVARLYADVKHILAPRTFARVVRRMFAGGGMDFAVQLAYFLLLFLFPFTMVLVHMASLVVQDPAATVKDLVTSVRGLPPAMTDLLTSYLSKALEAPAPSVFALSAFFTLAAGLSAAQHIIRATNDAHGVRETRPLWKRLGIALLLVFGFALFVATILFLVLSPQTGPYLQRSLGLPNAVADFWYVLRWPLAFVALILAFAILYRVAPNTDLPFRLVFVGGLMAAVFLIVATEIFSLWASYLFRPTQLYGQLGGGIVLLLWLFGIGLVVLFGIQIDAELARVDKERKGAETGEQDDS